MRALKEAGAPLVSMVAITEKSGVFEWLEGRLVDRPNILALQGEKDCPPKRKLTTVSQSTTKIIHYRIYNTKDATSVIHYPSSPKHNTNPSTDAAHHEPAKGDDTYLM